MCVSILGVCVVAAQLTAADISYSNNLPTTASSYDGVERNISQFYTDEQTNWYAEGYILIDDDKKLTLGYNHGIDTEKYDVSKSYTIGYDQIFDLKENHYLTVGGSYTYGGRERHTACRDSYDREYYCGNLTAFSDFKQPEHKVPYSMSITYTYKF